MHTSIYRYAIIIEYRGPTVKNVKQSYIIPYLLKTGSLAERYLNDNMN